MGLTVHEVMLLVTFYKVIFSDESLNCSVLETPVTENSAVAFFLWFDFIHMCQDSGKLMVKFLSKVSDSWHLL